MAIREETGAVGPAGESMPLEAAELPYARRLRRAAAAWRPSLRIGVAVGGVAIVVATAVVTANLFAERLRELAIQAALDHAESIVRVNLDPVIDAHALDMGVASDPELDEQLVRLVQGGDLSRIIVWSSDGRAVYSSDPA
ncbi:MAG: hypothetical protein ACRDFR_06650, partial [Candidatus Limnocylindria bacterium]